MAMANFLRDGRLLAVWTFALGVCLGPATAQTFTVNPNSPVELTPGTDEFTLLSCTFTKNAASDVIGWVVNGVRISNNNVKITEAIGTALGEGASSKLSLLLNQDGDSFTYSIDFFGVTDILNGEYYCQLCSDNTCGNVLANSTVALVQVEYEPSDPPTCRPSTTTRVTLGDSVTIYCASDPGIPTVQLQWRRNTQVIEDQSQPVIMDGVLYNNYTFVPGVADDDPGVSYICYRTSATTDASCNITPFIMVSYPEVAVIPPSESISPGSSATYTCTVTSDTNTPIVEYNWSVSNVDSSRYTISNDGRTVTIADITTADHEKVVSCEATDAENMRGSGQYYILVEGEVIPSNLPPVPTQGVTEPNAATTEPVPTSPAGSFPMAAIIAIVVIGLILLGIIIGVIWYFQRKKKQPKHGALPPKIEKNDLSPVSAAKTYSYKSNYGDIKQPDPDVIPKGPNERPVDVDDPNWWKGSGRSDEIPLKQANISVQSMGSNTQLEKPYSYDPAYDDKADPAELDMKQPLDGIDYGYRGDDYGYPDKYNDMYYENDYAKQRTFGDGQQDPYSEVYGDGYTGPQSNYDTMYGDDYNPSAAPIGSGYDQYPDRMPDGSEGYEPPPPEGYDQGYDGYNADYGRPDDYSGVGDYNEPNHYGSQPNDYGSQSQVYGSHPQVCGSQHDMGYDAQPAGYDNGPNDYDYQGSNSVLPDSYNNGMYNDQYNPPFEADRNPDGGAPDNGDYGSYNYPNVGDQYVGEHYPGDGGYSNDPNAYNDGYGNNPIAYDDQAGYPSMGYEQYPDQYEGAVQPQGEPYFDPSEEVSATSNPSYV